MTGPIVPDQNVFIRGTGRWYHGSAYSAKVVDIRESDDTVKARGYKCTFVSIL